MFGGALTGGGLAVNSFEDGRRLGRRLRKIEDLLRTEPSASSDWVNISSLGEDENVGELPPCGDGGVIGICNSGGF